MNDLKGFVYLIVLMFILTGVTGCDGEGEITDALPDPNVVVNLGKGDTADFEVDGDTPAFSRYAWFRDDPYGSEQVGEGKLFSFALTKLNTNRIIISCKLQVLGINMSGGSLIGWNTKDERQWRIRVDQIPPIWEGTFILDSQSELDILSEFTQVTDQLLILNNDLVSLSSLSGLTTIGGNLGFYAVSGLTDLRGLQNLTSVGGDLAIYKNTALASLEGLHHITSINGNLEIHENDALIDLTGLSSLESIGGNVSIYYNGMLENLYGLNNLASINGILEIVENFGMTRLSGLSADLKVINGHLSIIENRGLLNLEDLNNITQVGGNLMIFDNDALTTLNGLRNILSIGESLYIDNNDALTSLGLDALNAVGNKEVLFQNDFLINSNSQLCTCLAEDLRDQVLSGEGIGGTVEIENNKDCSTP